LQTSDAEDIRDLQVDDWPSVPDTNELKGLLLQQLSEQNSPSLADMVGATVARWQSLGPDAHWQPVENRLFEQLEQLARSAASARLEHALTAARDGRWEGPEGAWSRFRHIFSLMPFQEDQRQSAISALRQVWLEQWNNRMDEQDFDEARSLYKSAFEAGVLREDWLTSQKQMLGQPVQTPEQAARNEEIALLLDRADQALESDRLMVPAGNSAYDAYQAILDVDPENPEAKAGIRLIAERYAELARLALDRGGLDSADEYLSRARQLAPDLPQLPELNEWLRSVEGAFGDSTVSSSSGIELPRINVRGDDSAETLIDKSESSLRANRRLEGYAYLLAALQKDPGNRTARRRLDQRAQRYIRLATRDVSVGALDEARRNLAVVNLIAPDHPDYAAADRALRNALDRVRGRSSVSRQTQTNLTRLRLNVMLTEASANLDRLEQDPGNQSLVAQAAEKIEEAQRISPQDAKVKALASRHIDVMEKTARKLLDQNRKELAQWYIDQLGEFDPGNDQLSALRQRLRG